MAYPGQPTVYNVPMPSSGTEYSLTFPEVTRRFSLRSRLNAPLQICFVAGQSGTAYLTVPAAGTFYEDGVSMSGSVYFQSPAAGDVAEIIAWS